MTFKRLSEYFTKLESTTLRNKMVEILASLFKEAKQEEVEKLCYLLQGRVAPLFESIEFGMADKMVMKAVALGLNIKADKVLKFFKQEGDLGNATSKLKDSRLSGIHDAVITHSSKTSSGQSSNIKTKSQNLRITDVFDVLYKIASSGGAGSQEKKIKLLSDLLGSTDPLSARYIVRLLLGKLRLGFSDMTILDGLSWMLTGDKSQKKILEAAYNVRPDLGFIAASVKEKGIASLSHVVPTIGTPILMARANRLTSAEEIFEKIGKCAVEFKYDGLRLQVHLKKVKSEMLKVKSGNEISVKMFSRNLEDVTVMFPDIEAAVLKQIKASEVIFEGEVVAFNPQTGVFVPFQETMQRKRKYDIATTAAEIPVKLFVFELLFLNGKSYITKSYKERKAALASIVRPGNTIIYAQEKVVSDIAAVEFMFEDSVRLNFEGIIAKKLDGVYQAGIRGWNWIKYKKAMNRKLSDTIDVLVMGFTKGEGKRTAFGVGQFLTGVYDSKVDKFLTVSKIGTGLTDEQFREFISRVKKLHAREKPPLYEIDKLLTPDIWLEPELVVEVSCDEITRSAVHTAGRVMQPSKSGKAFSVKTAGFALRFPRLERFRDDRRPQDATTVAEVEKMYRQQGVKT